MVLLIIQLLSLTLLISQLGQNACHIAAMEGKLDCLKHLCTEAGDNLLKTKDHVRSVRRSKIHIIIISATFQNGCSPFLIALECKNVDVVEYLAQKLTEKDLTDITAVCDRMKMRSGLHLAAHINAVHLAKHLINAGCKMDVVDNDVRSLCCAYFISGHKMHIYYTFPT